MDIDIKKVARLSALTLSEKEQELFLKQLPKIFHHFNEIAKINTEGVEPMVTPTDIEYVLRADQAEAWESPEVGLSNAPEKSGNLFKVPPVV